MANVLLGVTGSVAAIYTRNLFDALRSAGHQVRVVATRSALYFFEPAQLEPRQSGVRNCDIVVLDEDEWPGNRYERGDPVLHIELRRWADVLVIAPCDANTLGKLALGICDNCLTCVYRAWDRARPIVLAPAMNTMMWEHPATLRHLLQIAGDVAGNTPPPLRDAAALQSWLDATGAGLRFIMPVVKQLACDDVGVGAMASAETIVATVDRALTTTPSKKNEKTPGNH
jgi:phosphopantothenoylcysteine decarboxylase